MIGEVAREHAEGGILAANGCNVRHADSIETDRIFSHGLAVSRDRGRRLTAVKCRNRSFHLIRPAQLASQ